MTSLAPLTDPRLSSRPRWDGLTIRVSSGAGAGPTRLAAFDSALSSAGVADFNLIRLSSVIPPGSTVLPVAGPHQLRGNHGDRLYCVYAEAYATHPGEHVWAGIAWSRRNDDSGDGLFVEHHGPSRTRVEHDLRASLTHLSQGRGGSFTEAGLQTTSAECVDQPVCAIVIASYQTASWTHHES